MELINQSFYDQLVLALQNQTLEMARISESILQLNETLQRMEQKQADPNRDFIQANALQAQNLDI